MILTPWALLLVPQQSPVTPTTIEGTVIDKVTGQPIANVKVQKLPTRNSALVTGLTLIALDQP
jgi:hypothetical protein